jgi:tetratricopeptide (TPR) repeat protein
MMEKIEWYQEVLEIEPSSKVFFPLAKLLADNNQTQKSIAVLRQGLNRHPEFFEARLMLIDLLQQEQDVTGAIDEVKELDLKLTAYPGFWEAWAGSAFSLSGDKDLAAALRLMAAFLRHNDLSWADIINRGLSTLIGGLPASEAATAPKAPPVSQESAFNEALASNAEVDLSEQVQLTSTPSEAVSSDMAAPAEVSFEPVRARPPTDFPADDEEGDDEPFSLRTKTMAMVLSEQGDYVGAKEIYEEILAVATDPGVRADLEGRIAVLASKITTGPVATSPETSDDSADQGKNKLIQVLERLAGRLESRVDKT